MTRAQKPAPAGGKSGPSGLEKVPSVIEIGIHRGDPCPITVEEQGGTLFFGAEHLLRGLRPARVVEVGIDIGPEAVFVRTQRFPKRHGPLLDKLDRHDGLDVLEAVLPRHDEAQWRPVLLR